jgi:uncharacterized integral membrane protein
VSVRRWLPALGVTLVASLFTWWNRGERVAVNLGLFELYRAPLTAVVFLAFLAGMLSMLLLSLRHDRRVREELRARGLLPPAAVRAAAPAASAWGVARERTDERTVAFPRLDDDRGGDGDRTSGYPRLEDEDRGAADERTAAYPRLDADRGGDGDRPVSYPRLEDEGRTEDGDRPVSYPRRDEDPAA